MMDRNIRKKYTIYQSRRAWLVASTVLISTGFTLVDGEYQMSGHAAQVQTIKDSRIDGNQAQNQSQLPTGASLDQAAALDVDTKDDDKKADEAVGSSTGDHPRPEHRHQEHGPVVLVLENPEKIAAKQKDPDKEDSQLKQVQQPVGQGGQSKNPGETDLAGQPLPSLYEQTTDAYEKLVKSLQVSEPNVNGSGDAVLDSDQRHIAKAGQMIFGEPDKPLLGLTGTKNDYSNVSQMRLMADESFTQKIMDQVKGIIGENQKGTKTSYFPSQNTLVLGGGMPLTAGIYSSNNAPLNPESYYKMFQATLSSVANVLSIGMVNDKLTNNYEQGQYGIYLRVAVPHGVDPNEFVKTLNLDSTRFAAEMNFNVTLGIDRLIETVPGLSQILSQGLGLPVSGNVGSLVDAVLGRVVDQLNQKYGTNLSFKNSDSPFYPITIYPKATKVNSQDDPGALYLLVRGDELNRYSGVVTEAKIILTKFFMEALSWGGNIKGGAYGYLNFDLSRYQGNMSSQEMQKYYNADGQHPERLADLKVYADDSPYKVLTRYQLPPQQYGQAFLSLNLMDSNDMLSRSSHDYGENGDLGRDVVLKRADQKTVHPLPVSKVPTWRAYISLFDQEKVLNTKEVAGHSEEWAEVDHQDRVLPGQDLDHRIVKLANGQNFYDQASRFDRVIDYFDHQVLLDGQGFHPSQNVRSLRLERSVDPAGQKNRREDFAIYNRPFTVYYNGEMTLANGQVVPLRPTKLTVFQENQTLQSPLDSQRHSAFTTIEKQGEYLFSLIRHLQPKLLDQMITNYGQQIQAVVSESNQKLEASQATDGIRLVQKEQLDQLLAIQNQATKNHQLAPAILNANRDLAYQQIDREALRTKVAINNAAELSREQKQTLLDQVEATAQTGKNDVGLATEVESGRRVLGRVIEGLRTTFLGKVEKEKAQVAVAQAGQEKKQKFAKIAHVDQESLHKQEKAVDHEVAFYQKRIRQSKTVVELDQVLADGLHAINDVANPDLQTDYQPVKLDEIKVAVAAFEERGRSTKERFQKIAHVEPASLIGQEQLVDEAVKQGVAAIRSAKTKQDLRQALDRAFALVEGVAKPQLIKEFQPVSATDRKQAIDRVMAAGEQKKQQFKQVEHVETDSLNQQEDLVSQLVQKAMTTLQQVKTNGELSLALVKALTAINAVADPIKMVAYQPVSPQDTSHAIAVLQQLGQEKVDFFNRIIGADPGSLAKQKAELSRIISNGIAKLNQAETKREFEQSFQKTGQLIQAVANPIIQEEFQTATADNKTQAVSFLEQVAQNQHDLFQKVEHADQKSLVQQLSILGEAVKAGVQAINQAKTKGELAQASGQALATVKAVAKPVVEPAYQETTAHDISLAYDKFLTITAAKRKQFEQILHVDPLSLAKQIQILDSIKQSTTNELNQSVVQKDIQLAYDKGVTAVNLLAAPQILSEYQPVTVEERRQGELTLQNAGKAKKSDFTAINHVDQESLRAQQAVVDSILAAGLQELKKAKENGTFRRAVADNLDRLHRVKDPSIQKGYQPVTDMDRYLARQAINYTGQVKKQAIFAVDHGAPKSVQQLVEAVQQAVAQAKQGIVQATVQNELKQAVQAGLDLIVKVTEPVLEVRYQPVTKANRDQAVEMVNQAFLKKQEYFAGIKNVDDKSLKVQVGTLKAVRKTAVAVLAAAENQGQLHAALQAGLSSFSQVPAPEVQLAYQLVSLADKANIEKMLTQYGHAKQDRFAKMAHVDPDSLNQQQQQINLILDQTKGELEQAKLNQDVTAVQKQAITQIDLVADPILTFAYQSISNQDRIKAAKRVTAAGQVKNDYFLTIHHVDQQSLENQLAQLAYVLRTSQSLIEKAIDHHELDLAIKQSLADVQAVAKPSIAAEYRLATVDQKMDSKKILLAAAKEKVALFEDLDSVNQASLLKRKELLTSIVKRYSNLVDQAGTVNDVHILVNKGLQDINKVVQPKQDWQGQAVHQEEIQNAIQDVIISGQNRMQDFGQSMGVDQNELSHQQQVVSQVVKEGVTTINLAKNNGQLRLAVRKIKDAIQAVQPPLVQWIFRRPTASDRQKAIEAVRQKALEQKQNFEKIPGVAAESLAQQEAAIDQIIQGANQKLDEVAVNAGLMAIEQETLAAIEAVGQPDMLRFFQSIDINEANRAKGVVQTAGDDLKRRFNAVKNVDPSQLKQRIERIDQLMATANQRINAANTNADIDQVREETLDDLAMIVVPSTLTPKPEEQKQAHRAIDWAGAKKQVGINQTPKPDVSTDQAIINQLQEVLAQAHQAVDQAKTGQELTEQLKKSLEKIKTLATAEASQVRPSQAVIQAAKQEVNRDSEKKRAVAKFILNIGRGSYETAVAQLQAVLLQAMSQLKSLQDRYRAVQSALTSLVTITKPVLKSDIANARVAVTTLPTELDSGTADLKVVATTPPIEARTDRKVETSGNLSTQSKPVDQETLVLANHAAGLHANDRQVAVPAKVVDGKPVLPAIQLVEFSKYNGHTQPLPTNVLENISGPVSVSRVQKKQVALIEKIGLLGQQGQAAYKPNHSVPISRTLPKANRSYKDDQWPLKATILTAWLAASIGLGLIKKKRDGID